jgi:hypothetical protein
MEMLKQYLFDYNAILLSGLWWGMDTGLGRRRRVLQGSTLAGIIQRGELRIGLEVGYMPFEMIDNAADCAKRRSGTAGFRRKGAVN